MKLNYYSGCVLSDQSYHKDTYCDKNKLSYTFQKVTDCMKAAVEPKLEVMVPKPYPSFPAVTNNQ